MKNKLTYILLVLTVILWGISFAAVKLGMGSLYPVQFLFIRTIFATIIFIGILSFYPRDKRYIDKTDIPYIFYLAFMGIGGYFIVQYTALTYTTTVNASILVGLAPIIIVIYSTIVLREKLELYKAIGIGICFIGILMLISKGDFNSITLGKNLIGDLLIIVNACMLAVFSLGAKKLLDKYEPFILVAYLNIFALIMLLPIVIIPNFLSPTPLYKMLYAVDTNAIISCIFLATTCTVFAYYSWYRAIKDIGATKTSVFNYINPLVASIISFLFFEEGINVYTILGGICIIGGVILNNFGGSLFYKKLEM